MTVMKARVTALRDSSRLRRKRFASDQNGSLTVFTLVLFVLMIMMGGLAVDLMRYEQTRTALQNTLDRATLASASLTQTLDPTSVVNDYFTKAGMSQYLDGITVSEGINFRNVVADASAETESYFMQLIKQPQMDARGHSMAEQRINNVEITLVLDVSGSMASNNKLTNLKAAAKEFVQTVMSSDAESKIAISLVPFNGQVNLGPDLRAKYYNAQWSPKDALPGDPDAPDVNCMDLPPSVYDSTALPVDTVMGMTAHADTYSSTNQTTSFVSFTDKNYAIGYHSVDNKGNVWCPPLPGNIVRLPSRSISTLKTYIDGLSAVGATSINAGFKWGLAMIDPSLRSTFEQFRLAGKIPSEIPGRPFDFTDKEAMKVIVLMTDGEHFAQERIQDTYKHGPSPIYKSNYDGNYSIYLPTTRSGCNGKDYWVPHNGTCQATPWTRSGYGVTSTYTVYQLSWPEVWNNWRVSYVAWQFYARNLGTNSSSRTSTYNTYVSLFRSQASTTGMDNQLRDICALAKSKGVIVYGIAFEAPSNGQAAISNCATSPAHYFNASGLQISTAFRSIASNISQLRLTQ
jgi:Flp pilus assembly protein TadG